MPPNSLITVDPEILGGTPVFAGTRVPVKTLFEYLEDDYSLEEFIECFPTVTRDAAQRVLEESLIFRNPKVLQEHLRNLRQIDPAVEERTLWRAREPRPALIDQHRQRPRRIYESHQSYLHRRDQEENGEHEQKPFPSATGFPRVSSPRKRLRLTRLHRRKRLSLTGVSGASGHRD